MNDRITVTSAQVLAAHMEIRLAEELGHTVSPLIRRWSDASPKRRPDPRSSRGVRVGPTRVRRSLMTAR